MKQEHQDAVWRSLPQNLQEEISVDYLDALWAHSFDPDNVRIDAHLKFLEKYFGKYNLSVTHLTRPSFKEGFMAIFPGMDKPLPVHAIEDGMATSWWDDGTIRCTARVEHLKPYAEGQESKPELTPREVNLTNKIINEDGKISVPVSIEYDVSVECDDSIWLPYRMELAKEVVKVVYHHKNPHKDIIDETMLIVDGIVERLKGEV